MGEGGVVGWVGRRVGKKNEEEKYKINYLCNSSCT
jgi:hypothetical protein